MRGVKSCIACNGLSKSPAVWVNCIHTYRGTWGRWDRLQHSTLIIALSCSELYLEIWIHHQNWARGCSIKILSCS